MKYILGIDVKRTKTSIVLGDARLEIVERTEFSTAPEEGFGSFVKNLAYNAKSMIGDITIDAVGVSACGPVDTVHGILRDSPRFGWGDVDILDEMWKLFKVPVKLEHDAKAGALAEWKMGAGEGFKNVVFLTLETGLGAGMIINGEIYRGAGFAGEIGHIRLDGDGPTAYGKAGSWESFCSGEGIAKLAHLSFPEKFGTNATIADIISLAVSGEVHAVNIVRKSGEYLGKGLSILFDVLDPERVVLGTLSWRLPDFWFRRALEVLETEALAGRKAVTRVVRSEFRERIGDFAALITASDALKEGG